MSTATVPAVKSINIMVVGDGFPKNLKDSEIKQLFQVTIQRIRDGFALLPVGSGGGPTLDIEQVILKVKTFGDSQLGLEYCDDETICYFKHDQAKVLAELVRLTPKKFVPDRYIVVLAGNGNGACSDGMVMYVRGDVLPVVVAHEMGHSFAGLMDERGRGDSTFDGCLRWRNCSSDAVNTPWPQGGALGAFLGCNAYRNGIVHPALTCSMNNPNDSFCDVCRPFVQTALSTGAFGGVLPAGGGCDVEPVPAFPWQKAMSATDGVELLALIDTEGRIEVLERREAPVDALRPQYITGDTFAVIYDLKDGGAREIVGVAPIPMSAGGTRLVARSYSPPFQEAELLVPQTARLVRFTLVGMNLTNYRSRNLRLVIASLPTARQFLFVDEKTVQQLQPATVAPGAYDLQAAL